MIDFFAYAFGAYGDDPETDCQDLVHTIFLLLPAAGGAIGMLLRVLIGTGGRIVRGKDGDIDLYLHSLCFLVVWTCVYFIACNPFGIVPETIGAMAFLKERHVVPIVFIVLNILAFIVFMLDGKQYRKKNIGEIGEFLLAFVGGATGAYVGMALSGHKQNTARFGAGVPLMMAMHFVLLAIGYFMGYL